MEPTPQPESPPADVEVEAPKQPRLFRALGRDLLAGAGTELLCCLFLFLLCRAMYDDYLPAGVWGYAIGTGLVAGLLFAAAEGVAGRFGSLPGLLVGALLAPLVLLVGRFLVELSLAGNSLEAYEKTFTGLSLEGWPLLLLFVSGVLALYGPLLIARRRELSLPAQIYAMSGGAAVWIVVVAFLPLEFAVLNLSLYLVPILVRVALFPPALRAGDWAMTRVLRAFGQGEAPGVALPRAATRHGLPPGQRHQAQYSTEQAEGHTAEGRHLEAGEALARAFSQWPTTERALRSAESYARAEEPFKAVEMLSAMLAEPGADPAVLDREVFAALHGLDEWEALREQAAARPRRRRRARRRPRPPARPAWRAHAVAGCGGAVLCALALQPAYHPEVSAEVTRYRLVAGFSGDGQRCFEIARQLERGWGAVPDLEETVWWPAALMGLGVPIPSGQDVVASEGWYLRAAQAGQRDAMVRYAHFRIDADDERAAAAWFRRAAEAGNPHAMFRIGTMLRFGKGTKRDPARAVSWIVKAAEAGQVDAMFVRAQWLEVGTAEGKDEAAAARWFRQAALGGHPLAASEVRRLLRKRPDLKPVVGDD